MKDHSFDKHWLVMSTVERGVTVTMETKSLHWDCHILWQSYLRNLLMLVT